MKTIALRFAEYFAPPEGTIVAHEEVINRVGYVWYGKMGTPLSHKVVETILEQESPRILLIHSGGTERYWAYVDDISREKPEESKYPDYYHDKSEKFKTWFKVNRFELAPRGIMAECVVASSGSVLSDASKRSMSPYFIIIAPDD